MLELLFVALMQAAAGDPAQTPAAPATEQTGPAAPTGEASPPAEEQQPQARRCRVETITASRVRRQRVCRTANEDERSTRDAQDGMRDNDLRGGPGLPNAG